MSPPRDLRIRCLNPLSTFAPLLNEIATNPFECRTDVRDLLSPVGKHRGERRVEPEAHGGKILFHSLKRCGPYCHFAGFGMLVISELPGVFFRGRKAGANGFALRIEFSCFSLRVLDTFYFFSSFAPKFF